ncbi:SGNH/GDSL hydrolase family protein [Nocardia sp. NPDC004278]
MVQKSLSVAGALAAVAAVAAATLSACGADHSGSISNGMEQSWSAAWSAAMQRPSAGFGPNWSEEGFSGQTIRQVVRVTNGGGNARIRLSNRFGASPLEVTGATIALAANGAATRPDSLRPLTFDSSEHVVIPAGAEVASDAAELRVAPLESVTVTFYFAGTTGPATFHSQAWTDTYRSAGDHVTDTGATAFGEHTKSWYYLTDVEVSDGPVRRDTVVALGDSITDGFASTTGANRRYTDALADRLALAGKQRAVLNEGIGGNLVVNDSAWYGDRAAARFERDALDKPGVRSVIILEGVNDIGFSETDQPTYKPSADVSADQVIAGYRALIKKAHERGIKVVGATMLPFGDSDHYSTRSAAKRHAINDWIRNSGAFDGIADFATVIADSVDTEKIAPIYDSGDHLHPNDAGYHAMAAAVDIDRL